MTPQMKHVLNALRENAAHGCSSKELEKAGVVHPAAVVFLLRDAGHEITTYRDGREPYYVLEGKNGRWSDVAPARRKKG